MIPFALACGWGVLAALPVVALGERLESAQRARNLRGRRSRRRHRALTQRFGTTMVARVLGGVVRVRRSRRQTEMMRRDLPVAVDLVGVAVGAGCTPWQAVYLAAQYSPPTIAEPLDRALHETALGASFEHALTDVGEAAPALAPLTEVLVSSARSGAPIAASLARVAGEVRADIRRRAEARARTVPVRLLFPLVFCALPAFALLTVAPVVLDGFRF